MKIINARINLWLSEASHKKCLGFATGIIRIIAAIAQIALNLLGLIFFAIPNAFRYFDITGNFHYKSLFNDTKTGMLHIFRGVFEIIPGTHCCMDMVADGRIMTVNTDHPFNP